MTEPTNHLNVEKDKHKFSTSPNFEAISTFLKKKSVAQMYNARESILLLKRTAFCFIILAVTTPPSQVWYRQPDFSRSNKAISQWEIGVENESVFFYIFFLYYQLAKFWDWKYKSFVHLFSVSDLIFNSPLTLYSGAPWSFQIFSSDDVLLWADWVLTPSEWKTENCANCVNNQ